MSLPLSDIERRAALEELERRRRAAEGNAGNYTPTAAEERQAEQLRECWFKEQREFYEDPARRKVGFCTRRAGKTEGTAIDLLQTLMLHPNDQFLYMAQTLEMCRITVWKKMREYSAKFELPVEFNENTLQVRHTRCGGAIILKGADNEKAVDKLRGPKWRKVVLDESGHFGASMENLIVEVLTPALRDQNGTLILIGTAARKREGLFFKAAHGLIVRTKGERKGQPLWKVHKWSLQVNPHLSEDAKDLDLIMEEEGLTPDDPRFLREYMMIWAASDSERVFSGFQPDRNEAVLDLRKLPEGHDWRVMLGVDFGWSDRSAIAVVAYAKTHQRTYLLETWAKQRAYTDEIAKQIMTFRQQYQVTRIVGDVGGVGKIYVESIRRDYKINIDPAQKTEKVAHVEFMNSAFRRGDLMVNKGDPVTQEFLDVAWHENRSKFGDHEVDDRANAALYAWRAAKFLAAKQTVERGDRLTRVDQGTIDKLEVLHRKPEKQKSYWESFRDKQNHLSAITPRLPGRRGG